ncbi:hypothetical protein [Saccharothrix luteola]|uniref:hypothetical protein n=1 Tax=Saccharothrix luteola TaxID=2893018 RepID=UPI001E2B6BBF|nr:hypothetical protein [Saccharothrix luteola]MCC8251543.1 hypothetical protein [Saccharothrix luteola]
MSALDHESLTTIPGKLDHYRAEEGGFLAAGTASAERAYGTDLPRILPRLAVLVIHAETIALRKAETCLSYAARNGFRLLHALPFEVSQAMCDVVWRFQANVISQDSLAVRDGIYTHGTSIMLLLKDTRPDAGMPASSRLTLLKGSPDPAQRDGSSLRSELGAINNIFGFVHCADEPLDVLRELAVMLPEPVLSDVHQRLARSFDDDAAEYDCRPVVDAAYAGSTEHDIDSDRALLRLLDDIANADTDTDGARARALRALLTASERPGRNLDWFAFADGLRGLGIDPYGWDPLIVASNLVQYEVPGKLKLIPSFTELMKSKGELHHA